MILNKYQIYVDEQLLPLNKLQLRDDVGSRYTAIEFVNIDKDGQVHQMLEYRVHRIQQINHSMVLPICDCGYDADRKSFVVVYKIEIADGDISFETWKHVASALSDIYVKYRLSHGNLSPDSLVLDGNLNPMLLYFGMADIAFDVYKDSSVYNKDYAAPEKFSEDKTGFPYQSDIYSLGKILSLSDGFSADDFSCLLSPQASNRPTWQDAMTTIDTAIRQKANLSICLYISNEVPRGFLDAWNTEVAYFDVSPRKEFLCDILIGQWFCKNAYWKKDNEHLLIGRIEKMEDSHSEDGVKKIKSNAYVLNVPYRFGQQRGSASLTDFFRSAYQEKQDKNRLRNSSKEVDFEFYKELLNKEIEFIRKRSLRLRYSRIEDSGHNLYITFDCSEDEHVSSIAQINQHCYINNSPEADGVSYFVSAGKNEKNNRQNSTQVRGIPYRCELLRQQDKEQAAMYRLCLKDCDNIDWKTLPKTGYFVEDTSVEEEEKRRQLEAMSKVEKGEVVNRDLIYYLLNPSEQPVQYIDVEQDFDVCQIGTNGQPINYSFNQRKAINTSLLAKPLSVIQGPPGTGKTTVITEIVFQILRKNSLAKILITSQTNNAVDQVLENLVKNDIPVLRLAGVTEPRNPEIRQLTPKRQLESWKERTIKASKRNVSRFADNAELVRLQKEWVKTIRSLDETSRINQELVDSIRVIGATCNHIASKAYSKYNLEFDYVIMDESGKATPAESLVPIVMGKRLIFVGDHRQLPPMLTSDSDVDRWLKEEYKTVQDEYECQEDFMTRPSLFETVINNINETYKTQLNECRRSSAEQVQLTSSCFYEPEGDLRIIAPGRDSSKEHNIPGLNHSVYFIDMGGSYRSEQDNAKSSFNTVNAEFIPRLLLWLNQQPKIKEYSVGVLAGYKAQCRRLNRVIETLQSKHLIDNVCQWDNPRERKLDVDVFDRFQGLEKDVVIVDLVKSGPHLNLGFLESPNRINVALSRQKKLLLIVGDYYNTLHVKTRTDGKLHGRQAALQKYLEALNPECVISYEDIKDKLPSVDLPCEKDDGEIDYSTRSTNLNSGDVQQKDETKNQTWLREPCENPNRAVIELSTSSVKILWNTNLQSDAPFSFDDFRRISTRTNTGVLMDRDNHIDPQAFLEKVLPYIRTYANLAKGDVDQLANIQQDINPKLAEQIRKELPEHPIDVVHTVATAVYRGCTNKEEILNLIKQETGLSVQILSKEAEANATLYGSVFTSQYKEQLLRSEYVIMIDQGSGSMEISVFHNHENVYHNSLAFGTQSLKNMLFREDDLTTGFGKCDEYSLSETMKMLDTIPADLRNKLDKAYVIATGKALTWATGQKSTASQHDFQLTQQMIEDKIAEMNYQIRRGFTSMNTLANDTNNSDKWWVNNNVVARVGLPSVQRILEYFKIDSLWITSTGLWYGVYYQEQKKA